MGIADFQSYPRGYITSNLHRPLHKPKLVQQSYHKVVAVQTRSHNLQWNHYKVGFILSILQINAKEELWRMVLWEFEISPEMYITWWTPCQSMEKPQLFYVIFVLLVLKFCLVVCGVVFSLCGEILSLCDEAWWLRVVCPSWCDEIWSLRVVFPSWCFEVFFWRAMFTFYVVRFFYDVDFLPLCDYKHITSKEDLNT